MTNKELLARVEALEARVLVLERPNVITNRITVTQTGDGIRAAVAGALSHRQSPPPDRPNN